MNLSYADMKNGRWISRTIGSMLVAVMLSGLSACDEQETANAPQAVQTSSGQAGTMEREASTLSVSAGQSITLTVTPSDVGGFYAVRDDLNTLELVDHTADNYAEGVFIMLEEEPFSYTVTVPQCPAPGHEFLIIGEWLTEP
ncbi:MAG: hypothetical protein IIB17_10865, partial [Chloroflexi bacterium]|nr:hypothetical protein [Chloroflexota bacterium]